MESQQKKGRSETEEQFIKHIFITHNKAKHQKQIEHSNKQSKASPRTVTKNKSTNAELPDTRHHLRQFYFTRQAPPTDIHSKPQGKRKGVATYLHASPSVAPVLDSEPPPMWSVARNSRAGACSSSVPRTGLPALSQRGFIEEGNC